MKRFIREAAARLGFQKVGFAVPEVLDREAEDLRSWLKEGRHGTMTWMARRLDERTDPRAYYPPVKTIVSLAMNYYTGPPDVSGSGSGSPRWSRYAWGDDYHRLLKERLKALLNETTAAFPRVNGIACVDTSPIMEKVWAERAGHGLQGKHTLLISREYGSWLFLGELLLDVALEPDRPFEDDLCGDCTACLDACPTGALTAPYQIDFRRCISYLTTMYKEPFRPDQPSLHGWIYGCDVCQEVCPWNLRCAKPSPEPSFMPREFITAFGWEDWRELSRERWDDLLQGSAARWIGYAVLRRNIEARALEPGD
ncbi:MAG: tRNA epoxyqueuosine(34) reductase QueG [Calditrichaeota bacterium]|nr:tRNA epoxyqueuosine(34) reductase QueG [Calditrichota bacterium]